MNKKQLIRYMRALGKAYSLAKTDCEFGVVEVDSEAHIIAGLWENAAMCLAQDGDIEDYEWIKFHAYQVGSSNWD